MKILINERLSEHRCKTPEGYLICTDAILARTGKQTYRKNEIFKDSDDETEIEVDRTEDEVFSPQTLASFENKPVTVEHPDEDVNVHNYKEYAVGFVRDVHRGVVNGQPVILGNLVITDEKTIQEIENGEHTDLSCGYDCDIADEPNPCQRNIRGNHVALCECGRAGIARIVDSRVDDAKLKLPIGYIETTNSDGFHYITRADHARLMPSEVLKIEEALRTAGLSAKQVEYDFFDRWIRYKTSGRLASHGNIDSVKDKLVEPSKQLINDVIISMTSLGFKVGYTGKTWSGRTHLEFGKSCYSDREYHQLINEVDKHLDKIERRYNAPITYNYAGDCGPNGSGQVTLVVDINKMQIHDALIPPTKEAINWFESLLRTSNIKIDRKGLTPLGRVHYQVHAFMKFDQFVKKLDLIDDEMNKLGIPMTFSAGSDDDNELCTAGIDLDKQYVKDSQRAQKIQKIVKVVKSIK